MSKNDMDRFWLNVEGDRTLIRLEPHHLAPPLAGSIQGSGPRKPKRSRHGHKAVGIDGLVAHGGLRERQGQAFELGSLKKVPAIPAKATAQQLKRALLQGLGGCKKHAKAKVQVAGANHHKRFCHRAKFKVLAPPLKDMCDLVSNARKKPSIPARTQSQALEIRFLFVLNVKIFI